MSLRSPLTRRASVGGLAVAGLIAGHCLAYRFFGAADPHAHHHVGHSPAPQQFAIVAGLLVAAIGSVVDIRMWKKTRSLGVTALVLLATQLLGFVGLSILDRITGSPGTEVGSRAFWVGLAIQVVVAGIGAIVLAAFHKTVEAIDRLLRTELPPATEPDTSVTLPALDVALPSLAMAAGGPSFRGSPQPTG